MLKYGIEDCGCPPPASRYRVGSTIEVNRVSLTQKEVSPARIVNPYLGDSRGHETEYNQRDGET